MNKTIIRNKRIFGNTKAFGIIFVLSLLLFATCTNAVKVAQALNPTTILLGTASNFSVLAGSGITNTGATTITGDVGTFPTPSETGFNTVTLNGTNHVDDAVTQGAKNDLVIAYDDAAGRTPVIIVGTELGGTTLTPGVYGSESGTFGITGTLTLDGQGDPSAVFIFQMQSTLITASYSVVRLTNGAHVCNVFWQVGSSATIDTYSTFVGNVLALTSITVDTGATVDGRVLARNGAVTLNSNTIGQTVHLEGIVLAPASSTNPVNTSHTVTATVSGTGDPVVGRSVTFNIVSGPNAGSTDSVTTNSNGQASFTYTSNGSPGTDTIEASFLNSQGVTVTSNRVTKTWTTSSTGGLQVTKTGPASAAAGSTVTYNISVTSNASVNSLAVTDSLGEAATYISGDNGNNVLEAGETWTYTVSYLIPVNASTPLVNIATASGLDSNGRVVSAFGNHSVGVLFSPVLLVTKTGPTSAAVNTTVTYTITVAHAPSSDGSDVRSVSVTDNVAGVAAYASGDTNFDAKLNADETWTYKVSYLVPVNASSPLVNTATASGLNGNGGVVNGNDNHSVNIVNAGIAIEKQVWTGSNWVNADSATGPYLTSRCVVKFRVIVSNVGGVNLTGVVVTDPKYCRSPIIIGNLAVGTSIVKEYTLTWSKGQQVNTATASGSYGSVSINASDSAYYYGAAPAINVEKYVSVDCGKTWLDADAAPGPTILTGRNVYYKFVVTNVGNVKLTGISLSDSPCLSFIGCIPCSLSPGAKLTVTAGPVKARLLLNKDIATATGCYNGAKYTDTDKAHYYGTLITYTSCGYAGCGTSGNLLTNNFAKSFCGGMEIGYYSNPGYGYKWTSTTALKTFLKASGTSGAIWSDKLNPTSVSYGGGALAVQTATLTINVVFSGNSLTGMPAGLGTLHYVKAGDTLNGYTVNQILAAANKALAGQGLPTGYTFNTLNSLVSNLNSGFNNGVPTSWAQTYLKVS